MKGFFLTITLFSALVASAQTNRLISSYQTKASPSGVDLFLMDTLTNYNKISYNQLNEAIKTNPVLRGTLTISNGATIILRDASGNVVGGFGTNKWYGDGSLLSGLIALSTNTYAAYATNSGSASNLTSGVSITNSTLAGTLNRAHSYLYPASQGTNFVVDFSQGTTFTIDATNDVHLLHATNFTAQSAEVGIYIYANDVQRILTYNTDWQMLQTNAPTTVASNKCAMIAVGVKLPGNVNSQTNVVCGVASSQ